MVMITLEISELMATCLTRMLYEEKQHQKQWLVEEQRDYGSNLSTIEMRNKIMQECEELRTQLAEQGINRYFKY